jgi:hypothetical protein
MAIVLAACSCAQWRGLEFLAQAVNKHLTQSTQTKQWSGMENRSIGLRCESNWSKRGVVRTPQTESRT